MSDFEITASGTGLVLTGDLSVYSAAEIKAALLPRFAELCAQTSVALASSAAHSGAGSLAALPVGSTAAEAVLLPPLDLDLSKIGEFDTAGLQLLLMLRRESQRRLRVRGCSEVVRNALALCHLEHLIADESAAEAA
jgi:anti-anti-sigma regulatory factor